MRFGVTAVPGGFDSALTTVLDVLGTAESLRADVDPDIPPIEVVIAGVGKTARTRRGLLVPIEHHLEERGVDGLDLLLVPALGVLDEEAVQTVLELPETRRVREVLQGLGAEDRPRLAGGCTGTFLLAEAGCLDGMRATTSWWLSELFGARYPDVELDMSQMVVDSGTIITAGAAFAHIDLAIELVAGVSPRLADEVARHLLIDERPARSVNAALVHLGRTDRLVVEFEDWVRDHLSEAMNLDDAARSLGTTRRTLERRTREGVGLTPLQLVQRMRIERATHLQRTTELSAGQIAFAVGYRDASTLRRLLQS